MIKKLPKWVEIGGFTLAAIAGFVNAVGILGVHRQALSHLTGTVTCFSLGIVRGEFAEAVHFIILIASFILGSVISAYIVGDTVLKLGRRYSVALFIEGLLLLLSMVLLTKGFIAGEYVACAACGMQNAMTTTFSGAIVRTTHLSGLFTDLGIALGLHLRGIKGDMRKTILHLTLITGFIAGCTGGAFCYKWIDYYAMVFPAMLTILLAGSYLLYWNRNKNL